MIPTTKKSGPHTPLFSTLMFGTLALALGACGNSGGGNKSTLVYQESADVPTLDPGVTYDTASGQVVENIYETLLDYKGSSLRDLEPKLATGWELSQGGKVVTFKIRDGVKFHTGNPLTCTDAEYSLRRNLVTNSSASGNWFISSALLGTQSNAKDDPTGVTWAKISAAVKCDAQGQLVLTMPQADPAILPKLAYIGQAIVDSKHAKDIGEWDGTEATWKTWVGKDLTGGKLDKEPSGTGAYKLVKRDANSLALSAFEGYWGTKPTIQNVLIQKVPEDAARQQALLKGDADVVETAGRAVIEQQLKGKPGVTVIDNLPNTSAFAIFMNEKISNSAVLGSGKLDGKGVPADFFADLNVRKAFNSSFDVAGYIRDVQLGKGKPRTMLLPDSFPGYDASIPTYSYDAAKATAAFKAAFGGQLWAKGFVLNADYRAGSVSSQTAMEILKKNVEALNPKFRINLTAKQWSSMIRDSQTGKEAMLLNGWAPDYADPDNFLYTFYSSKGYYQTASNFRNAQIDGWLDQGRSVTDQAERVKLYAQVGQAAYDGAYYINVPAAAGIFAYRDTLQGVSAEAYNPMRSFILGVYWKDISKK
jgi:peptide/nickel transport system substrate-binding protein